MANLGIEKSKKQYYNNLAKNKPKLTLKRTTTIGLFRELFF